jgi:hypothetical protein
MAGYMLAEHPDIHRRLREEVLNAIGTRRPTYDDIRDMKYLRAFINGEWSVSALTRTG